MLRAKFQGKEKRGVRRLNTESNEGMIEPLSRKRGTKQLTDYLRAQRKHHNHKERMKESGMQILLLNKRQGH